MGRLPHSRCSYGHRQAIQGGLRCILDHDDALKARGIDDVPERVTVLLGAQGIQEDPDDLPEVVIKPGRDRFLALESLMMFVIEGAEGCVNDPNGLAEDEECDRRLRKWAGRVRDRAKDVLKCIQLQHDCVSRIGASGCICRTEEPRPARNEPEASVDTLKLRGKWIVVRTWTMSRGLIVHHTGGPHNALRNALIRFDNMLEDMGDELSIYLAR